jgi:hypothetical protein
LGINIDLFSGKSAYIVVNVLTIFVILYFLVDVISKRERSSKWWTSPTILSQMTGLLAGLLFRLIIAVPMLDQSLRNLSGDFASILSMGFLFGAPLGIGAITTYYYVPEKGGKPLTAGRSLFLPWGPISIAFILMLIFGLEGSICMIMASPIWYGMGSLGGIFGFLLSRWLKQRSTAVLSSALTLPFLVMLIEAPIELPNKIIIVENAIDIHAPQMRVWQEIRSVRKIEKSEHRPSLFTSMGFPRPIEATIDRDGVGAVRLATFEGGIVFTEEVTEWKEGELLSFSIEANTEKIPKTTLDEHVSIGGFHFDVLSGTYRIELISPQIIRLHLSSKHRMRTSFNWYSGLWSEQIMSSIQDNILEIIKDRCEAAV